MLSNRSGRGFTLVETIIFILVLSVGAAGIMTLYQNVLSRGADSLLRHKGLVLAQDLMDEILSKRWDEHTPNGGGGLDACAGGVKDGRNDTGFSGNSVNCDPVCDDDDASIIGFDAGESAASARRNWNDMDDYDGLVEDNQNGAATDDLKDPQGSVIAEAGSFQRRVSVNYVIIAGGDGSSGSPYTFALAGDGRGTQDPDGNCGAVSPRTNFKRVVVVVITPTNEEISLVSIRGNY